MKQYPTHPAGELDAGAVENTKPCTRRTWCVLPADHAGICVEVTRKERRQSDV